MNTEALQQILSSNPTLAQLAQAMGINLAVAAVIIGVVFIWTIIWKGLALWKSAKKDHKIWFIVLLLVNTVGILEILYIFIFSKISEKRNVRNIKVPAAKKRRR